MYTEVKTLDVSCERIEEFADIERAKYLYEGYRKQVRHKIACTREFPADYSRIQNILVLATTQGREDQSLFSRKVRSQISLPHEVPHGRISVSQTLAINPCFQISRNPEKKNYFVSAQSPQNDSEQSILTSNQSGSSCCSSLAAVPRPAPGKSSSPYGKPRY